MTITQFIDNREGNTLAKALEVALTVVDEWGNPLPHGLDVATAFFSPSGFNRIAPHVAQLQRIRLMLGVEPPAESAIARQRLAESREEWDARRLREGLAQLQNGLQAERDQMPFSRSSTTAIRALLNVLRSGRMDVRLYRDAFLHAKAYLFSAGQQGNYEKNSGLIVGSSNLTGAGMSTNLELNLGRYNDPVAEQGRRWFEELWEQAEPFDLAALYELPFAEWTPWDVFLRVLWQLYGAEVDDDQKLDQDLPLTSFQQHGVARALRLMQAWALSLTQACAESLLQARALRRGLNTCAASGAWLPAQLPPISGILKFCLRTAPQHKLP